MLWVCHVLISRDQLIVGRSAVAVREMMRALQRVSHTAAALAEKFNLTGDEGASLIGDLAAAGLIEVGDGSGRYAIAVGENDDEAGLILWSTTIQGGALAKARIGVPMPRAKAQELLDGVTSRADEVNHSNEWLHWVLELQLYGSFAVAGGEPVGDVDLAVRLQRRHPAVEYRRLQDEMIERDEAFPPTFVDLVHYGQRKLLRYLRGSSPRVDLVEILEDEPLSPEGTTRLVYRFEPPNRRIRH